MTTIYLVRHAQAEGNLYRRFHGHYNTELTATGRQQLPYVSRLFADIPLTAVYSSDLTRARRTAEAIAAPKGLFVQTDPRFREREAGNWDNVPFGELEQFQSEAYAQMKRDPRLWTPPAGESWQACTDRFLDGLAELTARHPSETIAVTSHSLALKDLMLRLFPEAQLAYCDNTAVSCIEYEDGQYRLRFANDSSHVPEHLSTYASQRVMREHPELHYNLWYRSALEEPELYIQYRREAWELIYGNLDGFDGPGFWSTALKNSENDPNALVFAMSGDRIAGILELSVNGYVAVNAGYIPFIYLREPWRHKGLGVQLLGHAVQYFQTLGRTKLQLRVAQSNTPAIGFYEKYGFRRISASGFRHRLLLMEKEI